MSDCDHVFECDHKGCYCIKCGKEEIEPCPFCGSDAFILNHDNGKMLRVQCLGDDCGVSTAWWNYKEAAIKAWNKRTEST